MKKIIKNPTYFVDIDGTIVKYRKFSELGQTKPEPIQDVIDYLSIRGFKEVQNTNIMYDRENGISVDILPGGGKVGPVRLNFPQPKAGEELVSLSALISLKLDCYACNGIERARDLGDVVELIKINKLPREFPVEQVVQDDYLDIWDKLHKKHE